MCRRRSTQAGRVAEADEDTQQIRENFATINNALDRTAEAIRQGEGYTGSGVHRAARIGAIANGGEIVALIALIESYTPSIVRHMERAYIKANNLVSIHDGAMWLPVVALISLGILITIGDVVAHTIMGLLGWKD